MCFNADDVYLNGLAYTEKESKKLWISTTVELVGIEFQRHPDSLDNLLDFDKDASTFYFQQSLSINAINKETQSIDRKAHLFWEIPTIDAKINELMSTLSSSGKAAEDYKCLETVKMLETSLSSKRRNKKEALHTN